MKERDTTEFMRYGGLSPVTQKGFDASMPTFHSPPARHGLYAFPAAHKERFLLGALTFDQRRMVRVDPERTKKDEYGYPHGMNLWRTENLHKEFEQMVDDPTVPDEVIQMFRERHCVLAKHARPRKFSHMGEIWHHIGVHVPRSEVLAERGSWVLTSHATYAKALAHDQARANGTRVREGYGTTKDHLEVFIERIQS